MKQTVTKTSSKSIVPVRPKYIAKIRKDRQEVPEDPTVELMGMCGLSYRAIRQETGHSNYVIAKRLRARGIKLKEYRDAQSPLGQHVLQRISYMAERRILDHIERHLLK